MRTWGNGEYGKVVKEIIDNNFNELDARMNKVEKSNNVLIKTFSESDWESGSITISRSEYQKANPCVEIYIKTNKGHSVVCGGYTITDECIKIESDMAYEGRVVIR